MTTPPAHQGSLTRGSLKVEGGFGEGGREKAALAPSPALLSQFSEQVEVGSQLRTSSSEPLSKAGFWPQRLLDYS